MVWFGGAYLILRTDWNVFKNYLTACEFLQIDPSEVRSIEYLRSRVQHVLSQWNDSDGASLTLIRSTLDEFLRNMDMERPDANTYHKIMNTVFSGKEGTGPHAFKVQNMFKDQRSKPLVRPPNVSYAERAAVFVREGKIKIYPDTVSETYVKRELRHSILDNYMNSMPKWPN